MIGMERSNKKDIWEKSITKDNITKRMKVEEIENGFLICISKNGEQKDQQGNITYIDKIVRYYAKTNPLDTEPDTVALAEATAKSLGVDSIFD